MLQYISTTANLPPTIVTAVDKLDELILSYFYNIKNEFGMKKILLLFFFCMWFEQSTALSLVNAGRQSSGFQKKKFLTHTVLLFMIFLT